MEKKIEVIRKSNCYEIYVNDEFKQSCDFNELSETLKEVENE